MNKPEMAEIEFSAGHNCLTAWVEGKYLGIVHTDGDGVYIRLHQKVLGSARRRSWSRPALEESGNTATDL